MEVQELLDRQFGLESTSTHSDPSESDSEAMSMEIQSSQDEPAESAVPLIPRDDQATTTAMNDLALRHGPQQDKETLQLSEGSNLSPARQNPVPEPALARSRKRKSPEPLELEITPPSSHEAANRAATKTVSGQLSRPTDPLNAKRLQVTSLNYPGRDKFDFPDDDPTPKKLLRKPGQPTVQVPKARGRPRKNKPETLPNKDSTVSRARVTKATHRETSLPQAPHMGDRNQIVEQSSLSDLGEKSSRRSAPLEEAQEESSEENENSDVSKTNGQRRTQDDEALLNSQEDQDEALLSRTGNARVTGSPTNDVTTGDESGHVPQLPDEANEDNRFSETEDMANVIEEEDSDDEFEFELFGGINCWNLVVQKAREVGVSRRKGKVISRERPEISTVPVQELVARIQNLASLYRNVGSCSDRDPNHEALENRLCDLLDELDEAIDKVSESSVSGNEQRSLIQDIYAHAIPSMVFMLRAALNCRSRHYTRPNDIESLQEVVDIQDMLIRLCEKARRWKAKPMTKAPIMNTVAKGILPYMRDLKDRYFDRELASRTELARHRLEEANFMESYKEACEQRELQKEQHHQRVLERRRLIYEQLQQMPNARDSRPLKISHNHDIPNAHRRSHSITSDQWTQPQNMDLVLQLLSKDSRDLPPQERYLAILNTPSLQNKLPEHIRKRALDYKELLIEDMGPKDFLLSIE